MSMPTISVIMSVYNAQEYLSESIESILGQTFIDFEFIIIDDGSTDNCRRIIETYLEKDNRINFISRENRGLISSLNEGVALAKGKYIARMDADDISDLTRFEKQVQILKDDKSIGLVSCDLMYFNKVDKYSWPFFNEKHEDIMALMPFHSPIVHAALMGRIELFKQNLYEIEYEYAEDYRLWTVLSSKTIFHNIPEVLYLVRQHDSKVSVNFNDIQVSNSLKIIKEFLISLNVKVWDEKIHRTIITTFYKANDLDLFKLLDYLNDLSESLAKNNYRDMINLIKSIFIVHNTKIPFLFIFHLLAFEFGVIRKLSLKQFLSLVKRSFGL